jgi:hypothetical protein
MHKAMLVCNYEFSFKGKTMAFRADEATQNGFEAVKAYFIPRDLDVKERARSEDKLLDLAEKYGPVVDSYPSWHPLVSHHQGYGPETTPNQKCGYQGLDHTRYFRNAFITCPYGDGQEVIDSVEKFSWSSYAEIEAVRLDVTFYQPDTTPILVRCNWKKPLANTGMIPASVAVPLMLQKELPCWETADVAETWETMRRYFLGSPHGSRSSLFVSQETALTMKKTWELLINTGTFGPIYVSNKE